MKQNNFELYQDAAKHVCPDATSIETPNVSGIQKNVLFANSARGVTVLKFNARPVIEKNVIAGRIYKSYKIPAPDARMLRYNDICIEAYPMIPGHTLQEHIDAGAADSDIRGVYEDVIRNFVKMDCIPIPNFFGAKAQTPEQTAYHGLKDVYGTIAAVMIGGMFYLMNKGPKTELGLYHYDISPKNIIVTPDGGFRSFIDLDSVTICDRNFALAGMGTRWQKLGYDINEMLDMVEDMSQRRTDRLRIKALSTINAQGKYFMWMFGNRKSK